jgi:hypothetical protein
MILLEVHDSHTCNIAEFYKARRVCLGSRAVMSLAHRPRMQSLFHLFQLNCSMFASSFTPITQSTVPSGLLARHRQQLHVKVQGCAPWDDTAGTTVAYKETQQTRAERIFQFPDFNPGMLRCWGIAASISKPLCRCRRCCKFAHRSQGGEG